MKRKKKVILVSHCILNQNTVVYPLARDEGTMKYVLQTILKSEAGIIQLPCPETLYLGLGRKPMCKNEYDKPEYRSLCRELSKQVASFLQKLEKDEVSILGIVGVGESPTCACHRTPGIFMEELFSCIPSSSIAKIDVPDDVGADTPIKWKNFCKDLSNWLEKNGL